MKVIEIKRKQLDLQKFMKRLAYEHDFKTFIKEDCLITENNVPKILYKKLSIKTDHVRQATKNIKYHTGKRTGGLKSVARIFGFNPRNVIRKDYCSATGLSHESPIEHRIICDFGKELIKIYKRYFPEIYKIHSEIVSEKILPEWKIENTLFTSGIINKNNQLKYHYDSGNIKNVLSNMIVFKKDCQGGYLSCPEYDIGFEVADNSIILFDGQNILHGVTPFKTLTRLAYRYSIVYYTLQQIWNCLPLNEEIIRIRKIHLKREQRRAKEEVKLSELNTDKRN